MLIYLNTIEQDESLNNYRIEVHALKSSAATVGALLLSKTARLLEVAAADGKIEKIKIYSSKIKEPVVKTGSI